MAIIHNPAYCMSMEYVWSTYGLMQGYTALSNHGSSFGKKKQNSTEYSNCTIGTESSDFVLIWLFSESVINLLESRRYGRCG